MAFTEFFFNQKPIFMRFFPPCFAQKQRSLLKYKNQASVLIYLPLSPATITFESFCYMTYSKNTH